jgi:HSP20 family protein
MTESSKTSEGSATTEVATSTRRHRDLIDLWGAFRDLGWPFGSGDIGSEMPIKVEEYVEENQLVIRAELPGVDPDRDISVTVENNTLTIRGERRAETKEETKQGFRSEFRYGSFLRQLQLPPGCSADQVSATYRDGVLEIRLPKPVEGADTRRVPITRG